MHCAAGTSAARAHSPKSTCTGASPNERAGWFCFVQFCSVLEFGFGSGSGGRTEHAGASRCAHHTKRLTICMRCWSGWLSSSNKQNASSASCKGARARKHEQRERTCGFAAAKHFWLLLCDATAALPQERSTGEGAQRRKVPGCQVNSLLGQKCRRGIGNISAQQHDDRNERARAGGSESEPKGSVRLSQCHKRAGWCAPPARPASFQLARVPRARINTEGHSCLDRTQAAGRLSFTGPDSWWGGTKQESSE